MQFLKNYLATFLNDQFLDIFKRPLTGNNVIGKKYNTDNG